MRVLLISHTCQSASEGQPKAEWLARAPGIVLRVLVPDRWLHYGHWRAPDMPRMPAYEFEVAKVAAPWVGPAQNYLHWYPKLRKTLLEFRPDVIDLWEEPWGAVSAQACWMRNRLLPRVRIIAETEQNIDKALPFPFERFRKYTLANADFAIGRSAEALRVLRGKGYRGPGAVVPNGVDTDLFRPLDRSAARRDMGAEGFVVGYVGRLVEEKGLMDLVDAVAKCPPTVNAVFVGGGPMGNALRWRAADLGIAARVRVLPGKPARDLPQLMNALDVLALPSRTTARWKEQFGRVIIEAHACGVPVVGSDSGAIRDVVGGGGLIFREGDPDSLASALSALAGDPSRARELGSVGRERALATCAWPRVAERMAGIYREALEAPARAGSAVG